jgi:hypothetical protein
MSGPDAEARGSPAPVLSRGRRLGIGILAIAVATVVWLPLLHLFFAKSASDFHAPTGVSPAARALAARHLRLWTEPTLRQQELEKMRAANAEWDFMGHTFLVWSLANLSLREPTAQAGYLEVMDAIIDETLAQERAHGMGFYLMPYASAEPYRVQPADSLFLDGEIALMLAARRTVEEKAAYRAPYAERVERITSRMQSSPLRAMESYPNECWAFDHVNALDAMVLGDRLDGSDHRPLIAEWLAVAKTRLVDSQTGLLIASYTLDGEPLGGPEGSTLWMVAHGLELLDPELARDQYRRAKAELAHSLLGFSWAAEWPRSHRGVADVDSGPILPLLDVSAGSSGMAFIAASAFADDAFLSSLTATLGVAAFPVRDKGELRYAASNQVGDAALLYAAVLGPLWRKVDGRP